jgi:hypothetical protein
MVGLIVRGTPYTPCKLFIDGLPTLAVGDYITTQGGSGYCVTAIRPSRLRPYRRYLQCLRWPVAEIPAESTVHTLHWYKRTPKAKRRLSSLQGVLAGVALMAAAVTRAAEPAPLPADFFAVRPANVNCVIAAAEHENVPANLLLAIASIEFGKNGQVVPNKNGSWDMGHFQINSVHWQKGGVFADNPQITQRDVAWRGCYNALLAAWLLHKALADTTEPDFWTRAVFYHSRLANFNAIYRDKLKSLAVRWGDWLKNRYTQLAIAYR